LVLSAVLKKKEKKVRIINSSPVPSYLGFIDNPMVIENWDPEKHSHLLKESALLILDTSEEFYLGSMRDVLKKVRETFVFDHHEPNPRSKLKGLIDSFAASTSELAIEFACSEGVELDPTTATAAYAGIVHDSGFFAFPKTGIRTFKAAIKTLEWGAYPNEIYRNLMENSSCAAILLQKQALANMEFYYNKQVAVIPLYNEDLEITGASYEDAENIVNIPLKAKEVEVSLLLKEMPNEEVRCSLRSKGKVNVSKIAQGFGGGGHVTAAGFKTYLGMEETLKKLLANTETWLDRS